jgi:hypothetical protein
MKAAVHRRFGYPDVVTIDDVPQPQDPPPPTF